MGIAAAFNKVIYGPGRELVLSLWVFVTLSTPAMSGHRPDQSAIAEITTGVTVTRRARVIQLANEYQMHRTNEYPIRTTAHRDDETHRLQPADTESGRPPRVAPELIAKAKAQGMVRVIVELRLPPHKEGSEESREYAIRLAQQAVLDELGQVNMRVIRIYASIPAIALAASVEALEIAAISRHVSRVTEDMPLAPFKP